MTLSYNRGMSTATIEKQTTLQVRVNAADKEKAAKICAELGTNLSSVTNMMLKQIVAKRTIPFRVDTGVSPYSPAERIEQTKATMAFEDMELDAEDIQDLRDYELAQVSRNDLLAKYEKEAKELDRKLSARGEK